MLEAIYNANQTDESHALEWKGPVDLTDRQEVGRSVAREILAMSNRPVSIAREYFGGYGILVIGVEPGKTHDVAVLDSSDLWPKVSSFIGEADGPEWDMRYVSFQGKEFLVIDVAPPSEGDGIFALRKPVLTADRKRTAYLEGTMFLRHQANAVQAVQADFDVLLRRAQVEDVPLSLDIEVTSSPGAASTFLWDQANVENWLDGHRRRLMQSVEDASNKAAADEKAANLAHAARSAGFPTTLNMLRAIENVTSGLTERVTETRTKADFKAEVDAWITALREDLKKVPEHLGAVLAISPTLEVHNRTEVNYSEVEVHLHLSGEGSAYETEEEVPDLKYLLPRPPRRFGPYMGDRLTGPSVHGSNFTPAPMKFGTIGPQTRRTNGGSFTLEMPSIDLRPHRVETIEKETVILIPAHRTEPVVLEWSATATNVNGTKTGSIPLSMEPPLDLFSAFLELCEDQGWPYKRYSDARTVRPRPLPIRWPELIKGRVYTWMCHSSTPRCRGWHAAVNPSTFMTYSVWAARSRPRTKPLPTSSILRSGTAWGRGSSTRCCARCTELRPSIGAASAIWPWTPRLL